jgi:alkylhydroperoxidase family enzyme
MMRIEPLSEPYEKDTGELLASMMPAGVPPIALFRTLARNPEMARAMHVWGRYELGRTLSIDMRRRELVIDRVCARCGCEYEWGVHVAFFAERAGLDRAQIRSLTHGQPGDDCWTEEQDRVVIKMVDSLHDTSTVDDALWEEVSTHFSPPQILDLLALAGWYHAISFLARGADVPLEDGAPRFRDYQ